MSRYITVVFEVNDQESFKPLQNQLKDMFLVEGSNNKVIAMGLGNEVQRIEYIERAVDEIWDSEWAVGAVKELLNLNHDHVITRAEEVIRTWKDEE